jgi:hypothetical protein
MLHTSPTILQVLAVWHDGRMKRFTKKYKGAAPQAAALAPEILILRREDGTIRPGKHRFWIRLPFAEIYDTAICWNTRPTR